WLPAALEVRGFPRRLTQLVRGRGRPRAHLPAAVSSVLADVRVKVADYAVRRGREGIATSGLGSCVAIVLYDKYTCTGGLAHILLPTKAMSRETSNPAKFPESIVP